MSDLKDKINPILKVLNEKLVELSNVLNEGSVPTLTGEYPTPFAMFDAPMNEHDRKILEKPIDEEDHDPTNAIHDAPTNVSKKRLQKPKKRQSSSESESEDERPKRKTSRQVTWPERQQYNPPNQYSQQQYYPQNNGQYQQSYPSKRKAVAYSQSGRNFDSDEEQQKRKKSKRG